MVLSEPSYLVKLTGLRALCRERLRRKKQFSKLHYCGFHHFKKREKKKTYPNASGTAFNAYKKKMGCQNESLRDFRENEKRAREKHGHPSVFIPLSQVTW